MCDENSVVLSEIQIQSVPAVEVIAFIRELENQIVSKLWIRSDLI